ncbi:hypothetical protein M3649_21220 [Ureibacillus chungkukjangi]|uniref:hypothetical protein n=1 Tax=Ureibacillus chungkukjangi TaxID=1202712 RepID=UPI00203FCDBB|nr:hypothetical protein [Ureibacillus chungkukjangi]MCM3390608.1 hypothetical protein [Ureibacillus chungkukjangi]
MVNYFTKKKEYKIEGTAISERNPYAYEYERPHYIDWELEVEETDFIKWNRDNWKWLPNDKEGVYVIYKEDGTPLYIGTTGNKDGFRGRLRKHNKKKYFLLEAGYIKLYYIANPTSRLLFERIKIHQLEPILNRDFKHLIEITDDYVQNLKEDVAETVDLLLLNGITLDVIEGIIKKEGLNGLKEELEKLKKK